MIVNSFKVKYKKLVLSRLFLLIPILTFIVACHTKKPVSSNVQSPALDENIVTETDTDFVFTAVEVLPVPPDGMGAFLKSISDNYVYPKKAKKANVKGDLVVAFIVEKDGRFSNIKVTKDIGYGIGEEIVRILKNSPIWTPGVQSGKKVRVQYNLLMLIGDKIETVRIPQPSKLPTAQSSSGLFSEVEQPPVPLDGMPAFLRYIGSNYVAPKAAVDAKVSGRIELTFVVERDGSITDVKILSDLKHGTGEEAIRVLKGSPKWKPGLHNGETVRVQYTLPIVLNLSK